MGVKSKRKGYRLERGTVKLLHSIGLEDAIRVPLSGASPQWKGDIEVAGLRCEVKGRASGDGFKVLERWLGDNDVLFLRRDRQLPLVLMPWKTWRGIWEREPGVRRLGVGFADAPPDGGPGDLHVLPGDGPSQADVPDRGAGWRDAVPTTPPRRRGG